MRATILILALLMLPQCAMAQVVNPTGAVLTVASLAEHAQMETYQLEHRVWSPPFAVIWTQTYDATQFTPDASNDIFLPFNSMPLSFGHYKSVARACATDVDGNADCSVDSDDSNEWFRKPGKPAVKIQ